MKTFKIRFVLFGAMPVGEKVGSNITFHIRGGFMLTELRRDSREVCSINVSIRMAMIGAM